MSYRHYSYAEGDDYDSYYDGFPAPPLTRSRSRSRSRLELSIDEDRGRNKQLAPRQVGPEINVPINLTVPSGGRLRASSTGARPQPNLLQPIIIPVPRSSSRHRGSFSDDYSDDDGSYGAVLGRRKSRERISRDTADKLARLQLLEEENNRRLRQLQHGQTSGATSGNMDAAAVARLARLDELERQRRLEEEENRWRYKLDDTRLRDEEKKKALLAQFEIDRRRAEQNERDIVERAENRRKEKEAAAKIERSRVLLEEKDRLEKEKEEQKEQRLKILRAEEERKEREKREKEELRVKILAEEEDRKKKQKDKEKKDDAEFHAKVREKFVKAGYSPDFIDDVLDEKTRRRPVLKYGRASDLAIDFERPTFIRVQEKHLLPETLNIYGLPWEYDPHDRRYIIIKRYISHDHQQELFLHTAEIIRKRETRYLITDGRDGYTKETISTTTLKPGVVKGKNTDEMYLVRRHSTSKSKSPGRSWLFT